VTNAGTDEGYMAAMTMLQLITIQTIRNIFVTVTAIALPVNVGYGEIE